MQVGHLSALLEPGDIVLFASAKQWGDAICAYQRLLSPPYSQVSTEFSHSAIYVGADDIVHALVLGRATVGGVQRSSLGAYAMNRTVCALRWPRATQLEKRRLAHEAQLAIGTPYDYTAIADAMWHLVKRRMNLKNYRSSMFHHHLQQQKEYKRLVCSEFILRTYADVYGASSPLDVPGPSPVLTPADLYVNEGLQTVGGP